MDFKIRLDRINENVSDNVGKQNTTAKCVVSYYRKKFSRSKIIAAYFENLTKNKNAFYGTQSFFFFHESDICSNHNALEIWYKNALL